ncbi:Polyprenol reductase [Cercospora zeina]
MAHALNQLLHTSSMDVVVLLRSTYLSLATLVLVLYAIPPLRTRFMSYGARQNSPSTPQKPTGRNGKGNPLAALLDQVANICVPHNWFASFYAVSVCCSLYWATELMFRGPALVAASHLQVARSQSMTLKQVQVAWLMMFAQGSRRLLECLSLSKPSQSQMWVGHWALGILFYVCTNVAVWIEGIPAIEGHTFSSRDIAFSPPSFRSFAGFLIFILASGFQHDCHAYLSSLKSRGQGVAATYCMPDHPAWNVSLTPHYFAECLIYLAIAIVAAPQGHVLNVTMLCALTFVAVNLGVTADGTKKWYTQKFGVEQTKGRARMIPFVY